MLAMTVDEECGFYVGAARVRFVGRKGRKIKLGVDAPPGVKVLRDTLPGAAEVCRASVLRTGPGGDFVRELSVAEAAGMTASEILDEL